MRLEQPLIVNVDLFVAGTFSAFMLERSAPTVRGWNPRRLAAALGGFHAIVTHGGVAMSAPSAASPWTAI